MFGQKKYNKCRAYCPFLCVFQDPGDSGESDHTSASEGSFATTVLELPGTSSADTTPPRPEVFNTPPRAQRTFSGPRHSAEKVREKRDLELSPRSFSRGGSSVPSPQDENANKVRREKELASISSVKMAKDNILKWKKDVRTRRNILYDDQNIRVHVHSPVRASGTLSASAPQPGPSKKDESDVSNRTYGPLCEFGFCMLTKLLYRTVRVDALCKNLGSVRKTWYDTKTMIVGKDDCPLSVIYVPYLNKIM
jgi:hypothetical protein